MTAPLLLTAAEVAALLSVEPYWVKRAGERGLIPRVVLSPKRIRYSRDDLPVIVARFRQDASQTKSRKSA